MQTLGLTLATAATDAGADSALQPNAGTSSDAGAIFQTLMTAAGEQPMDVAATADTALPPMPVAAMPVATIPVDGAPLDRTTKALASDASSALAGDLATDLEHMVQALAITAEVVAQGMAARTTPVREIILTVETPTTSQSADPALPKLSVLVPTSMDTGLTLKISDPDLANNIDPALVAFMPPTPPVTSTMPQVDSAALVDADLEATQNIPVVHSASDAEMPLPQAFSVPVEEPYGPWRAEIHGPVLNAQRQLILQSVHIAQFDAPELTAPVVQMADAKGDVVLDTTTLPDMAMVLTPDATAVSKDALTDTQIRVVTIQVPVTAKAPSDVDEATLDEISVSTIPSEPLDVTKTENLPTTQVITSSADFIGPQLIQMVPSDIQRATLPPADNETLADTLNAPRPTPSEAHVVWVSPALPATVKLPTVSPAAPPVLTQPAAATPGMSSPTAAFDVAAVVDALHRDADLSRAAHRHAFEVQDFETGVETNIANHVAKTSSRSSNDIHDLMKLGVRDIEIIQGTGSAQTMNVSPQVQTNELVGASTPARAQVTDAFASTSQEANTADRRAQAHEIRMRAIERQVVAAVRDGADTIRMQLYPPGLGQIIIRLTMDGSKLKLTTSANSSDAADSLRSIEGDLREALSVGGLELTGFDVSEDGEGGHKNHKNTSETDTNIQQTRSAKSDDFALDMNA